MKNYAGFDIVCVETFSRDGETTDLEFPGLSHLAGNKFCVMATSAANEWVFSIDDHVVNSRSAKLKEFLSERQTLLQQCSEKEKETLKFDELKHFYLIVFVQAFRWLWNEPLNKLPLAMKHTAWVLSGFQTVAGAGLGWKQCGAGAGKISWIPAEADLNFAGVERTKNFNPRRTLVRTQDISLKLKPIRTCDRD